MIWLKGGTLRHCLETAWRKPTNFGEWRTLWRELTNPSKKLVKSADAYLKQAEELRCGHVILRVRRAFCKDGTVFVSTGYGCCANQISRASEDPFTARAKAAGQGNWRFRDTRDAR